jgi:hypothetical protein
MRVQKEKEKDKKNIIFTPSEGLEPSATSWLLRLKRVLF